MHPASMQAIAAQRGSDLHMDASAARLAREAERRAASGCGPHDALGLTQGARSMMPYDSYRLYQAQRPKSAAEMRRADDQAGRLAAATAELFRSIARPGRVARAHRQVDRRQTAQRAAERCIRC
jgi:hypothetical protein